MKLLAVLTLAAGIAAQTAPINLAANYDCQQWVVQPGPLEPPVVTRTATTLTVLNPSFTRSSFPFVQTDFFRPN